MFDTLRDAYEKKLATHALFAGQDDLVTGFTRQMTGAFLETGDCATDAGREDLLMVFRASSMEFLSARQDVLYFCLDKRDYETQLAQEYHQHWQARDLLRETIEKTLGLPPRPDLPQTPFKSIQLSMSRSMPPHAP